MNPVVGLDVAKGESQVQAFLDQSKPYGKSFSIKHTREELDHFIRFLKEIYRALSFFRYSILGGTRDSLYLTKSHYFLSGKEV